jgi:hypothetical protein
MHIPYSARFMFPVTHGSTLVVDQVMAQVRDVVARGGMPVVLFDLDGTLFDNGPRTWQILYEFSLSQGRHALTHKLQQLPKLLLPYALREILQLVGEDDADTLTQAAAFWKDRFFVDGYIVHDEPVPGAIQFCQQLWEGGATLVYFSGRDAPNMLVGTTQSLRTHGFPVGQVRTLITLKERFEKEDLLFKREALAYLKTLGTVVGSFDNEPANCNMFHEHFPTAENVAVATAHAPNPKPLHPAVKVIADFAT